HRILGRAGRVYLGRDRPERCRVFPAPRPALPVWPSRRKQRLAALAPGPAAVAADPGHLAGCDQRGGRLRDASAGPARPPRRRRRSRDGGLTGQAAGALPGGNTDICGPWFSASGHGLLLTVAAGIPWEPGSGGTPPIRVWTTADWGSSWSRGSLLPLGGDSLTGTASFTPAGGLVPGVGWSGWLVVDTAAFAQHVAVADGGPLRLLPASPTANN